MELILMRHATTQGNLERRFIGLTDLPILESGAELARQVSPTLPKIDLDESSLTCRVDFINGRTCRVTVTEGDSHYDGPHENRRGEMVEGDTLQISYTSLKGADTLSVGDTITFSYHYNTDVSEKNGDPHISVSEITVSK